MTSSQVAYRQFSEGEATVPPFAQGWWLDATCGVEGWDVSLVMRGDDIHAALPYRLLKHRGFRILSQPPLTPFLGPWLRATSAKKAHEYSRQKDLMAALIAGLPQHDQYRQNWSSSVTNWLPFYWSGFQQTTRYTYVLDGITDADKLWAGLRENIRSDIRKAEGRAGVTVDSNASLDEFLQLNALTFERQGRRPPYSERYVRQIDQACQARNCRRIFVARGPDGRPHAGAYIVWDAASAYYLLGGGDPELRNSGATSLCMWEAIRFASGVSQRFDFEGSMIESVERFFRAFGAEQTPYFSVQRTSSRLYSGLQLIRSLVAGR